jgi:hypothetical protein
MRRIYRKPWFRLGVALSAILVIAAVATCWHYRVRSYRDYQVYREIRRYPMGDDLWFGRVHAGQDLAEFTAAYPAQGIEQLGPFTVLTYYTLWPPPPQSIPFESLGVVAKDRKLIAAGVASCTWKREFFAMAPERAAELNALYEQKWALQKEQENLEPKSVP